MLPGEQEAHEVGARDRLDLAAQAIHGVAVDARQEAPVAPVDLAPVLDSPPVKEPRSTAPCASRAWSPAVTAFSGTRRSRAQRRSPPAVKTVARRL
jgi:hypothetical protein